MYVIDARHYLTEEGDIAVPEGPARKMADFVTAAVAHASDLDRPEGVPGPTCFKCGKRDGRRAETGMTDGQIIAWQCLACGTHERISGWQGTLWDLSQDAPST